MSPLRILHVAPYYEQAWGYGGIPRVVTTVTRALARRGHHVTVFTTDAGDDECRADPPRASDVRVRMFPNLSNRLAYRYQAFAPRGFAAALRRGAGDFDVAHLHACHNLLTAIAARVLASTGVPYVVTPNGTAAPIERRIAAKRLFAATAGRTLLPGAARVLAVSEAERRTFDALGVLPGRQRVVPNPVDVHEFDRPPDPEAARRRLGVGDGPLVAFLGQLTPRKGADLLVRAFARVRTPGARLVVAGNDMGAGADVDAAMRAPAVAGRVIRAGLLRGAARLDLLAAADVVVYASRDEAFGLVPLEALLAGTPVVVADDGGCGEVVSRVGGGRLVRHGDTDGLARAVDAVLADLVSWRGAARRGGVEVRRLFAPDTVARQLECVYAETLARPLPEALGA